MQQALIQAKTVTLAAKNTAGIYTLTTLFGVSGKSKKAWIEIPAFIKIQYPYEKQFEDIFILQGPKVLYCSPCRLFGNTGCRHYNNTGLVCFINAKTITQAAKTPLLYTPGHNAGVELAKQKAWIDIPPF